MTINYRVIDNFMPEDFHKMIWKAVTSQMFPWYYGDLTNRQTNSMDVPFKSQPDDLDDYHFIHHFYDHNSPRSQFFDSLINPLLENMGCKSCIRIKANWYPRTERIFENPWHKDYPFEHKGAVYYLNSNDGMTIFDDENNTVVESVANRLLLFDSHEFHRSTTCTNAKGRFNINFNYF